MRALVKKLVTGPTIKVLYIKGLLKLSSDKRRRKQFQLKTLPVLSQYFDGHASTANIAYYFYFWYMIHELS